VTSYARLVELPEFATLIICGSFQLETPCTLTSILLRMKQDIQAALSEEEAPISKGEFVAICGRFMVIDLLRC